MAGRQASGQIWKPQRSGGATPGEPVPRRPRPNHKKKAGGHPTTFVVGESTVRNLKGERRIVCCPPNASICNSREAYSVRTFNHQTKHYACWDECHFWKTTRCAWFKGTFLCPEVAWDTNIYQWLTSSSGKFSLLLTLQESMARMGMFFSGIINFIENFNFFGVTEYPLDGILYYKNSDG